MSKARNITDKQIEIEERQEKAWRYKVRGLTYREISKRLGVSESTIKNDLRSMRQQYGGELKETSPEEVVAESLQNIDELIRCAWQDYYVLDEGDKNRASFLTLLQKLLKDKVSVYEKLGTFANVDDLVEAVEKEAIPTEFLRKLSPDFRKNLQDSIIDSMLTGELEEPELSPIALDRQRKDKSGGKGK